MVDDYLWAVSVDKQGNKWLGTGDYGLIKFDGSEFTNLNEENSEIKGIFVSPIFTDSKGNVWLNFSKPNHRIAKFDGKNWEVFKENDLPTSQINVISIIEDIDGNVYFGGANGVLIFDGKKWKSLDFPSKGIIIRTMDIDEKGNFAIGHNSGLILRKNGVWKKLTKDNSDLQLSVVRAVKFVNDKLLVGYGGGMGNGGLSIIENDKWTHFNKTNSKIPDHMVRDIEIDNNGTIWMATNNGMIKMVNDKIEPIYFREGMYKNTVLDIETEGSIIWVATNFGLIKITQ